MRVGQRPTSRSVSTTTMTGCKTAPKPEPQETQAIRCRIQELYCDHSVRREAVDDSLACDKDLESNAERQRNRCPVRRLRGRDRARGVRQTLHCGPNVRFLPPFFYGCCKGALKTFSTQQPTAKRRWHTGSRQITEVKHRRAGLVPGWVTTREHPVL